MCYPRGKGNSFFHLKQKEVIIRNGFGRTDDGIQKRLRDAETSGDPERIKKEQQFAKETYAAGTGATIGGAIGLLLAGPVGLWVGGVVGGFIGNESAK